VPARKGVDFMVLPYKLSYASPIIVVSDNQTETYNSTDRQTDISDITDGQSSIEINTLNIKFSVFSPGNMKLSF
jgi:hypothetical protein